MRRRLTVLLTTGVLLLPALVAGAVYDPAVVLDDASVAGTSLAISPDGRYAVYVDDADTLGEFQLYSVALDGSDTPEVRRLATLGHGAADVNQFEITPDSTRVVYRGNLVDAGTQELYSAPIFTEGQQVVLSTDDTALGGDVEPSSWHLTPDGSHVVYKGRLRSEDSLELFSAPVDAAGQQELLSLESPGGDVIVGQFDTTPDAQHVVHDVLPASGGVQLYSTPIDGSTDAVLLNGEVTPGGNVEGGWQLSSDSRYVLYVGDLRVEDVREVYSAPIGTAGGQVRLNADPPAEGDATAIRITPDATRAVWQGDLRIDNRIEVFSAPIGGGAVVRLSADPVAGGTVGIVPFEVTPDSTRVVYAGDLDEDGDFRLRSAPVDQAGLEVVLSDEAVPGGAPGGTVAITPDSSRVVFIGDLDEDDAFRLYSAPVDQSGQQDPLYDAPVAGSAWVTFRLAPDGSRVVFVGDFRDLNVDEVWSAPTDGSQDAVRLHDEPVVGGDALSSLEVTNDSTRVIHLGDLRQNGALELYTTPIAGGPATPLLTGGPIGGSGLTALRVSDDSSFVVFSGDQRVDGEIELYVSGVGQAAPGAPTSLAVTDVTTTGATVTWDPPVDSTRVGMYEVTTDPPVARRRVVVDGDTTTVALAGLQPDTAYTVSVVGSNAGGDGPEATTDFTTDASDPGGGDPGGGDPGGGDPGGGDPGGGDPGGGDPGGGDPLPGGVVRLAGESRYETAADVALERFDPADVDTVLLATGTNFPDALAGGSLAAALGAPILLVAPGELPDVTAAALATLDPDEVVALGGEVAVGEDVLAAAASAAGATADRISGDDRYATATAIADALGDAGGDLTRAFVAIGTNFPDAVAAGPATAGAPILLTDGTALSGPTAAWLDRVRPAAVTAVGGEAVLLPAVLDAAAASAGGAAVDRLAGESRYLTATAIADTLGTGDDAPDTVYVAVGTNFPDALTGGPAAAAEGAPVVLAAGGADELPADTAAWLDALPALRRVVVIGGDAVVTPAVATQLTDLLDAR